MHGLSTALWITALGMGLVFGAILLLWLTMVVLTALTAEKETPASDSPAAVSPAPSLALPSAALPPAPSARGREELEGVALLAVAMALAEQKAASAHPLSQPPMTLVSAWQLGMRMKQFADKGKITRR